MPGAAPVTHTGCCPGTPWEDLGPSWALSTLTAQQVTGCLQQLPMVTMVTMLQGSGERPLFCILSSYTPVGFARTFQPWVRQE